MQRQRNIKGANRYTGWVCASVVVLVLVVFTFPQAVHSRDPRKTHVVQAGESVAKIADYYGISQRDLREMNGLRKGRSLRVGQKLKVPNVLRVPGKKYRVKKGDTLASIGAKFKRTVSQIAHANKLSVSASLQVGRTLVIPDKEATSKGIKVAGREIKPILFLRVRTGERKTLRLYTKKGKLNKGSVMRLSRLSRDKIGNKVKRLNFRLVKMIQLVAEEFPDKPIEIISGYRAQQVDGEESQHAFGRALDFRIRGVSPRQIYRFCKTLPRSGCGFYPTSGFVHMDAREKSATWVE
ncbi:MAG: LysM peptidoglycan-binding domain-containing protein [Proteobacteria bacterium]|nr:LysM peptidoglycan-binding domain-containing protein [Pseudomonadota bacterium]